MNHFKSLLFLAFSSISLNQAFASTLSFSCNVYTQNYQTHNSGQINLASTIEGVPGANSNAYPSLPAEQRSTITQVMTNYCLSWGRNKLNSLTTAQLPIGGFATVSGAGYLWVNNGIDGFNIVMQTQYIYKTSAPIVDPCARLPYYKRYLCSSID